MKTKSLFICFLIAACVLLSGCSESREGTDNSSVSDKPAPVDDVVVEEEEELMPDLPGADMDGKEFTISTSGWFNFAPLYMTDVVSEGITGETLNDAVFDRMTVMADKYNCTITQVDNPDQANQVNELARLVTADDDAFDLILFRTYSYINAVTSDVFVDLTRVPYIDVDMPWWDRQSYDSLSLAGRHFAAASDITTNDELSIWCVFFNKDMRLRYSLDNPYDLVKEGTWTYDRLFTMGSAVSNDNNGNGKVDTEDTFGLTHTLDAVNGLINSMDVRIAENNPDGTQSFTFTSEENLNKILYLFEHLCSWNEVYNIHKYGTSEELLFMGGHSLFMASGIYMCGTLRSMEEDFGILPFPKYDEAQKDYHPSNNTFSMTLVGVPKTNRDLENTGIFLEDFAYLGFTGLRPAFYDTILMHKVARDDESGEILNEIFSNVTYDIGGICNFNNYAYDLCAMTMTGDTNISSFMAKKQTPAEKIMQKVIDSVESFE